MFIRSPRLFAALILFVFITAGKAQDGPFHDVKVEVRAAHEELLVGYTVSLHNLQRPEDTRHSSMESGDTYIFRYVPAGDYMARVFNAAGELRREEMIRVGGGLSIVRVELPKPRIVRPTGDRISVRQLQNPPSRKAIQAFQAALKFSAAREEEKAAVELEKAIRISPAFAPAYTNLAAMHIRLRQYERAIDDSTRAMEVGTPNVLDLSNRALAQWALARYEDAMSSAEQALRLDGNAMTAHFVVGSLLAENPKTVREGIRHLERAAERYPDAARKLARTRAALR